MKDRKTTILGIIGGLVGILTLVAGFIEGKPVDMATITNTVTQLLMAIGLIQAADSK